MLASAQNSLLAPKKQSLLQLNYYVKPTLVTVFYEAEGTTFQISLDVDGLSTSSSILLAVQRLNADKGL